MMILVIVISILKRGSKMLNKKTVAVAMSGGVDSSLTAKLLLDQGYQVVGLTLKLWGAPVDENGLSIAEKDAQKVAQILKIPHHIIDCQEYFYDKVVQNFFDEYKHARTPNPCVLCNKLIKFGMLFQEAQKLGAEYFATGHYVQKYIDPITNLHYLCTAANLAKDQTYVLYNLTQEQLQKCIFPLGVYTKDEVRKLSQEANLPVFNKPDSQEICFIPNDDYRSFLAQNSNIKSIPGDFINTNGEVIGKHQGLTNYTIGQRKGFNIGFGKKMYVVELRPETNQVVLGDNNEVFASQLQAKEVVFSDNRNRFTEYNLLVKIRYNAKPAPALVKVNNNLATVLFETPQRAITAGQSVVFYENNLLIGGGIIQ